MSIQLLFAWYDLWIGVFIDRPKRRVYVFPLPTLGVVIGWGRRQNQSLEENQEGRDA